jgi:acyl dehydratase
MTEQHDRAVVTPPRLFGAWLEASAEVASGLARANQALWPGGTGQAESVCDGSADRDDGAAGVAFTERDWDVRTDFAREGAVSVGDTVRFSKVLTDDDVAAFAAASGDTNRLHLDDEFADDTRFGGTIVHGTLVSGLISAALARLPGVVVYLSQDTEFTGPVVPGEEATATVEVVEDLGGERFRLQTTADSDGESAVEGEAVVLVDDLPEE